MDDNVAMGVDYWDHIFGVRDAVNRELENQRSAGALRGGLDADVVLYCSPALKALLAQLGDELRFVLITSAATLAALESAPDGAAATELPDLRLQVTVSGEEKCERCWHRRPEVGRIAAHPTLCERCVDNIDGDGEQRRFA
jgi:isoleucyl-tRNA synthetase